MTPHNDFYQDDAEQPSEAPEIRCWPSLLAVALVAIIAYFALRDRPANGATIQLPSRLHGCPSMAFAGAYGPSARAVATNDSLDIGNADGQPRHSQRNASALVALVDVVKSASAAVGKTAAFLPPMPASCEFHRTSPVNEKEDTHINFTDCVFLSAQRPTRKDLRRSSDAKSLPPKIPAKLFVQFDDGAETQRKSLHSHKNFCPLTAIQLTTTNAAQVAQQLNRSHSQARVELVGNSVIVWNYRQPIVLRPWDVVRVDASGFRVQNYAPYVGIVRGN